MFHEVDAVLRALLSTRALAGGDVRVAFDAPTATWTAQRNTPTVNAYLYDIREEVSRRERGPVRMYGDDGRVAAYRQPPRYYRVSYLVTAWTKQPEDEHRLLSAVLGCLLRHETLPAEMLPDGGMLAAAGTAVPVQVAVPRSDSKSVTDIWSTLGGELKPSLDVAVVAPFLASEETPAGPPVTEAEVRLRDRVSQASDVRRKPLA